MAPARRLRDSRDQETEIGTGMYWSGSINKITISRTTARLVLRRQRRCMNLNVCSVLDALLKAGTRCSQVAPSASKLPL